MAQLQRLQWLNVMIGIWSIGLTRFWVMARAVHRWETMDIHASLEESWMKPLLIDDLQAVYYRNAPSN